LEIRTGRETIGYVYAVEDGLVWDKIWYKSNLESSESDCYLINDDTLKNQLKAISGIQKVKLSYDRHFFTLSMCPEGTENNDEIIGFDIVR